MNVNPIRVLTEKQRVDLSDTNRSKGAHTLGLSLAVILLGLFCVRLLWLGPTHTDDAIWMLGARQGQFEMVTSWAKSQGRIFAFVSGALIYLGDFLETTAVGNLLHLSLFAAFFIAIHAICAVYIGRTLAILTALVNVSLFAVRWEGSVLTTYPIFAWFLGLLFIGSIWLGRWSVQKRSSIRLAMSSLLLFISLNIHEGTSVLFAIVALFCAVVDLRSANLTSSDPGHIGEAHPWRVIARHPRFVSAVAVIAIYFACYFLWRIAYPTQYDGNRFGSLSPSVFLPVLISFSCTGTSLANLLKPYKVNYADAISADGEQIRYSFASYFSWDNSAILPLLASLALAFVIYRILSQRESDPDTRSLAHARGWFLLVSLFIAFTPVLPVSLVGKYQEGFFKLGVHSYAFTPLCHFGWSMFIATGLYTLCRRDAFALLRVAAGVLIGVVGFATFRVNDAIVSDIRRETSRWTAVEKLDRMLDSIDRSIRVVYVPRFASGSWFTVVPPDYWRKYVEQRFGRQLEFRYSTLTAQDIEQGAVLMDYAQWSPFSEPCVWVADLRQVQEYHVQTSELRISFPDPSPSKANQTRINYLDTEGQPRTVRLASLPSLQGIRKMTGIRARPESVSLTRESVLGAVSLACEDRIPVGMIVRFGNDPDIGGIPVTEWFRDGWHPIEANGRWSKDESSAIYLPNETSKLKRGRMRIELSTLTGLGFSDIPQRVTVLVNGHAKSTETFSRGVGFRQMEFDLDGAVSTDNTLVLEIAVDRILNPASLKISEDNRDLGALVRFLRVEENKNMEQR